MLATVALDLARRLDAGPTDRDATLLARELRQVRAAMRIDVDPGSWLEGFLRDVTIPRFAVPATDRPSYGAALAKVAEALGTPLMPWQTLVAPISRWSTTVSSWRTAT